MSSNVFCATHGEAGPAFICGHAHQSFKDRVVTPLFWTNENKPDPCGWCEDCQVRYEAAGNEWIGEAEKKLGAQLICEHCFREIVKFNGYM